MITQSERATSRIVRCEVTVVDRERGVCTLMTADDSKRIFSNVPWASAFASREGHAIDFCPSVRDVCFLLEKAGNDLDPMDDAPVILAWHFPETNGRHGAHRASLYPGDIQLSTRIGARMLLSGKSGDMLVQAGPACGWTLFRGARIAELLCDKYEITTKGGDLHWGALASDEIGEVVQFRAAIKKSVGDDFGFVNVYTSDAGGGHAELAVVVGAEQAGMESRDPTYSADIYNKPGRAVELRLSQSGDMVIHASNKLLLSANTYVEQRSLQKIAQIAPAISALSTTAEGTTSVHQTATRVQTRTDTFDVTTLDFKVVDPETGETVIRTANEEEHEGKNNRLVHEQILDWLFNHTHPTPSGPSTGPLGAPVPSPSTADITSEAELWGKIAAALTVILTSVPEVQAAETAASQNTGQTPMADAIAACGNKSASLLTAVQDLATPPSNAINSADEIITQETKVR